jgi:hypothetical protein
MSVFLQPIYTQTVGAGGVGTVTFNNVPQTFTDLYCVVSVRGSASQLNVDCFCSFSGQVGIAHSQTRLNGNGSSASSDRPGSGSAFRLTDVAAGTSTTNTFSSASFYIPNYTSTNFRSVVVDSTMENNATLDYSNLSAVTYSSSAAITSVRFDSSPGNFVQYSTFTLYGITKG